MLLRNFRMLRYLALLLLFGREVDSHSRPACERLISESYLDVATDMIAKAKINMPTCSDKSKRHNFTQPVDCTDVLHMGHNKSGVHTIWPINRVTDDKPLDVYCDMDTDGGGWTVIQRRGNFQRSYDYFYKDWKSYKEGFGNIDEDFWLGNDNIFALTNQKIYSVRFDLEDVESSKRYAQYDSFWIDSEYNNYTLHIDGYSGDAGDSMIAMHNNQKFSTKDRDNDNNGASCAQGNQGAWWYSSCHYSNLNGLYFRGKHDAPAKGVNWYTWKGNKESLESTEIKFRPKKFRVTGEALY